MTEIIGECIARAVSALTARIRRAQKTADTALDLAHRLEVRVAAIRTYDEEVELARIRAMEIQSRLDEEPPANYESRLRGIEELLNDAFDAQARYTTQLEQRIIELEKSAEVPPDVVLRDAAGYAVAAHCCAAEPEQPAQPLLPRDDLSIEHEQHQEQIRALKGTCAALCARVELLETIRACPTENLTLDSLQKAIDRL